MSRKVDKYWAEQLARSRSDGEAPPPVDAPTGGGSRSTPAWVALALGAAAAFIVSGAMASAVTDETGLGWQGKVALLAGIAAVLLAVAATADWLVRDAKRGRQTLTLGRKFFIVLGCACVGGGLAFFVFIADVVIWYNS